MRLTQNKIEEILINLLGEESTSLIKYLIGKENVSEFDLANKIKKDIKIVRKMLYILYNHNLVSFTRKKDKQKGWYIYYWTLQPESIRFSYFKRKRELLERLKLRLEEEKQELFFICPNECVRLNFDQAMEFEFHCPECGELVNQDDSKQKIHDLEKAIASLEQEVGQFLAERREHRKEVKEKKKEKITKKKINLRKKAKESPKSLKKSKKGMVAKTKKKVGKGKR